MLKIEKIFKKLTLAKKIVLDVSATAVAFFSKRINPFAFYPFAEEGNSSCRNVQHNFLASVNFLNIFSMKKIC